MRIRGSGSNGTELLGKGPGALETAIDRCFVHTEGPSDLRRRLAILGQANNQGDLLGTELGSLVEFHVRVSAALCPAPVRARIRAINGLTHHAAYASISSKGEV